MGSGRKFAAAGGGLRRQRQDEQFFFTVDLNCRLRQGFAIQRRLADLQLKRVEHQPVNRVAHVELHRFCAGESQFVDVWNDANGIVRRDNFFRQFSRSVLKTEGFFRRHGGGQGNGQQRREKSEHHARLSH